MAEAGIFAPGFKTEPFWWEAAPIRARPQAVLSHRSDVVVIGGGYAGLSAALQLAKQGIDVTVLEATSFGLGASTRNGGMVSGGANIGKGTNLAARIGRQGVHALLDEAAESYRHFEAVIVRENIDCDYQLVGRFTGAHTPAAFQALAAKVEQLNRDTDAAARLVPKAEQRHEIASDHYHGGMVVERTGGIHPGRYHAGLLDAARRAGAKLVDNARVTRISGKRGNFRILTMQGEIAAEEVLVATNGYTDPAMPWHRRRVIPVASNIVATEEIGEERIAALFPNMRMIGETARILNYFRPSPDRRRIIFGGRASFRPNASAETVAQELHRRLVQIFPQLADIRLTHAWSGNVAFTFDRMPHMGEHAGIHFCLGCNGSGVAMMSYLGHRTALKILDRQERPSAFEAQPFHTRPLYSGNPWFMPAIGSWYRLLDRWDRVQSR